MNNVQKAIDSIRKKIENVPVLVEESCQQIAAKAQGRAKSGIYVTAVGNTITAMGDRAAYREFGTGEFADRYTRKLPEDWDEYAWSFVVNEKGTLRESPYLFPSYEEERVELIKKIKESFERR